MLSTLLAVLFSAPVCSPRESFPAFVTRFKADAGFREARIRFPLSVEYQGEGWGPQHPGQIKLSAEAWNVEVIALVTAERESELAGSEGELCESSSGALDERTLIQYSCDTDVYGNSFHFQRHDGCWMLVRVERSGS